MIDSIDMAQEGLEKAHHHEHGHGHQDGTHPSAAASVAMPRITLFAAVCTAVIAALAVVVEMSANDAQTEYLAHDVAASDLWAQYQAKSVRRTVLAEAAEAMETEAEVAASGPVRTEIAAKVAAARAEAAHMQSDPSRDGMEQLAQRAHIAEAERDAEATRHVVLERAVRGLQIAIVLIGLFLTTRLRLLLVLGLALAGGGLVYGLVMSLVPGMMAG